MKSKMVILFAILAAFSLAAWSQSPASPVTPDPTYTSGNPSTGCAYSFSSGAGHTFTQYCLTENGNIVQFSNPENIQFFNSNTVSEGYGLCDFQAPEPYFDYASEARGFGPTIVSRSSSKAMQFVRRTLDGQWELTQTVTQLDATSTSPGSLKLTLTLKNLSGEERIVVLARHANVDANKTADDDRFYATRNFAYGAEPGLSFGLGLTTNTFDYNAGGITRHVPSGPNPCAPGEDANFDQYAGSGSIGMIYTMTIPAGSAKTVQMTYKPL